MTNVYSVIILKCTDNKWPTLSTQMTKLFVIYMLHGNKFLIYVGMAVFCTRNISHKLNFWNTLRGENQPKQLRNNLRVWDPIKNVFLFFSFFKVITYNRRIIFQGAFKEKLVLSEKTKRSIEYQIQQSESKVNYRNCIVSSRQEGKFYQLLDRRLA